MYELFDKLHYIHVVLKYLVSLGDLWLNAFKDVKLYSFINVLERVINIYGTGYMNILFNNTV